MQNAQTMEGSLTQVRLFQNADREIVRRAEQTCRHMRALRNQVLLAYGEPSEHVYFILHGAVRCMLHGANGRVVSIADFSAGDTFGELAAIDGLPVSVDVVALEDTMLAVMPAAAFRDIMYRNDQIAREVLLCLSQRVRSMTNRMVERSTLEVGGRLRSELLRLASQHGGPGRAASFPALPHAELAARIGANREAVTRELLKLAREGLIETKQRKCLIRDLQRFRGILSPTIASVLPLVVQ